MKYELILSNNGFLSEYDFVNELYKTFLDTADIPDDRVKEIYKLVQENNTKSYNKAISLITIKETLQYRQALSNGNFESYITETKAEIIKWIFLCGNLYDIGIMSKFTKNNLIDFDNKQYFNKNITILEATFILLGVFPNLANENIGKNLKNDDEKYYFYSLNNIFYYKTPYGLLKSFFADNEYQPMTEFLEWAVEKGFLIEGKKIKKWKRKKQQEIQALIDRVAKEIMIKYPNNTQETLAADVANHGEIKALEKPPAESYIRTDYLSKYPDF